MNFTNGGPRRSPRSDRQFMSYLFSQNRPRTLLICLPMLPFLLKFNPVTHPSFTFIAHDVLLTMAWERVRDKKVAYLEQLFNGTFILRSHADSSNVSFRHLRGSPFLGNEFQLTGSNQGNLWMCMSVDTCLIASRKSGFAGCSI